MKKYFCALSLIIAISIMYFASCDKVEPPYKETETENQGDTVRKILLEEFTGHQCPNCPNASTIAQQLKTYYGEQFILISIHAGELAEPDPYGTWSYDFTTFTGDDIYNTFPIGTSIPKGLISRTDWGAANFVLDANAWGTRIESIKNDTPKAIIEITNSYNTSTRMVNSAIECDALMDITGTYKICAYLTEDSIVKPQQTQDSIAYHYIHRHVLRGSLNGTWGDTLLTGTTPKNAQFIKNCSITLNSEWNENHCYVVAFIYDASTYEIIQVEEKRVK